MLMEAAAKYRRLRAPQEDGQKLFDPPWSALPKVVIENGQRARAYDGDLEGRTLRDLAASARAEFVRRAASYTAQYTDVPENVAHHGKPEQTPILIAGHQPQLFHPGVWFKNFALDRLARDTGGVAVHLLIDSDLCRAASIRVPTGTVDEPHVTAVAYDRPAAEVPFEERTVLDEPCFSSFAERVEDALLPMAERPVLRRLWPVCRRRQAAVGQIGLCLAQGRHLLEHEWGSATLEVPLSTVCQLSEFHWFVGHLLAHLPRFWNVHNEALAEYRRAHRLRNRAQPVPDLVEDDGWLEAPFWVWSREEQVRRPLFARQTGNELTLSDRHEWSTKLELSADRPLDPAVEQLAALAGRGVKIRTRALTTTLFARLFLCDLFVHGIGGAKYDQVTDGLIREFFGITPPRFAACSATLRLPLPRSQNSVAEERLIQRDLRELTFHPERYVSDVGKANSDQVPGAAELVAEKRRWIDTPKTAQNAAERHRGIAAVNAALQPFVAERRNRLEARRIEVQEKNRSNGILGLREYSFSLYPETHLKRLLLD